MRDHVSMETCSNSSYLPRPPNRNAAHGRKILNMSGSSSRSRHEQCRTRANPHPTAQRSMKRLGRMPGLGKQARRLSGRNLPLKSVGMIDFSSVLQLVHVANRAEMRRKGYNRGGEGVDKSGLDRWEGCRCTTTAPNTRVQGTLAMQRPRSSLV